MTSVVKIGKGDREGNPKACVPCAMCHNFFDS